MDASLVEKINGTTFTMLPASMNHYYAAINLLRFFEDHLDQKEYGVFGRTFPLYLSEENQYFPDCMVIHDQSKIGEYGVCGAPDLVVEVISPYTAKNDRIGKKDVYEKYGVKEYWIVSTGSRCVEVHHLRNGKLELEEIFFYVPITPEDDPEEMDLPDNLTDAFPCELFPGLLVPLATIFDRVTK